MTRDEMIEVASRAIHLEEWCPERERCSGRSGSSDRIAKTVLDAIEPLIRADERAGITQECQNAYDDGFSSGHDAGWLAAEGRAP